MMLIVEVMSLLLEVMYVVESTPEGAPLHACESMNPSHGGQPQTSPCPYRFVVDMTEIFPNESVTFTIKAPFPRKFMGFMVQARNAQGKPIGYLDTCSYRIKIFDCPGGEKNTATHARAFEREEVDMLWFPPFDFIGEVTFYATVAENRETFWVKQKVSPTVKVVTNKVEITTRRRY